MNREPSIVLSIVIPVYNEKDRVELLATSFKRFSQDALFSWELLFVDDGSEPPFQSVLLEHSFFVELHKIGKVIILRDEHNLGKGAAIERGVQQCRGQFILTLDADLSAMPDQVISWVECLRTQSTPEVWVGSREHMHSKVQDHWKRRVTGRIFNLLIRMLLPIRIKDTQCGFKIYPAFVAQSVIVDLKVKGWAHDVEIFLKLNHRKIRYQEQPVIWNVSVGSKISLVRDSWKMFSSVCYLFVLNRMGKLK